MESTLAMTRNRVELRIIHSMATMSDAWMTVGNSGNGMSYPVRTQLGMPLTVIDGDDTVTLRYGRLFVNESSHATRSSKSTKKPTFGFIHYLADYDVEQEAQERFHVKLHIPTDEYAKLWELASNGNMPRMLQLQVKGLQSDGQWDIADSGTMLLVEDFTFSFLIGSESTHSPV
jgi:hypothetical protein